MSRIVRFLEWVFFVYFLTHIPIAIFIDSQVLFPLWLYPQSVIDLVDWFSLTYKDSMIRDGPAWYRCTIVTELVLQLPFFFVASYAFFKGSQKWIRIPAIIYSSHVTTTVFYILAEWNFGDFDQSGSFPGPLTREERVAVSMFYLPYFVVPLIMLMTMLISEAYQPSNDQRKKLKYP